MLFPAHVVDCICKLRWRILWSLSAVSSLARRLSLEGKLLNM